MTPLDENSIAPTPVMETMDKNQSSEETCSSNVMTPTEDNVGSHSATPSQGSAPIQSLEAAGNENELRGHSEITPSDPEKPNTDLPKDETRTTKTMDKSTYVKSAIFSGSELKQFELGMAREQATVYVKHVGMYFSAVESRIRFLEGELYKLRPSGPSSNRWAAPKTDSGNEELSEACRLIPDISYMSWSSFKPDLAAEPHVIRELKKDHYTPKAPTHVLEVLVGHHWSGLTHQFDDSLGKDIRLKSGDGVVVSVPATDRAQRAERLRINSKPLLELLIKLCGAQAGIPTDQSSTVFLRPYKLFMVFEKEIRGQFELLKTKNETRDGLAGSTKHKDVHIATSGHATEATTDDKEKEHLEQDGEAATYGKEGKRDVDSREVALQHLGLLERFFDNDLRSTFELRSNLKTGKARTIEYADLWHLYEPGQEIRSADNQLQIYQVTKFTGGRDILCKKDSCVREVPGSCITRGDVFSVECYRYDFDGIYYGPVFETFTIRNYEGLREITSLPVYPWLFDPNYSEEKKKLLKRGKKFIDHSIHENSHKAYTALSLDDSAEEVDSQIIIDFRLALQKDQTKKPDIGIRQRLSYDPRELQEVYMGCKRTNCCSNDFISQDHDLDANQTDRFLLKHKRLLEPRERDNGNDIEDDVCILFPYRVHGFVLRSRKWAIFNIDDIKDVMNTSSFDGLILPPGHKETVEALVRRHSLPTKATANDANEMASMDLVKGKGKGLIILLHGAPGVGKTSTAECVADQTKRPLFPITCGDLGETAIDVEENLEQNFRMAHKWGCVLLLDEADVFLAERQKADLRRNAVVSVFLRTLEYYSGILFLTTNRVGCLDPAFKSRIHISLYYPQLNKRATRDIWKTHVKKAKDYFGKNGEVQKRQILEFSRTHFKELEAQKADPWNGRQIRNAFQTAIALAEHHASVSHGKPVLSESQFKQVAEASKTFDSYLRGVHGGYNDAQIARSKNLRNDIANKEKIDKDKNTAKRKAKNEPETTEDDDETSDNSSSDDSSSDEDDEANQSCSSSNIDRFEGNLEKKRKNNRDKAMSSKEDKALRGKKKKQRDGSSESEEEAPTKKGKKKDVSKHGEDSEDSSEEIKVVKRSSKEKESNKTTSKSFKKEKS